VAGDMGAAESAVRIVKREQTIEDMYRDHDLQWGMCSAWVFDCFPQAPRRG
jgi:hypothetical protein